MEDWNQKSWLTFFALSIAVLSTYAAASLGETETTGSKILPTCAASQVVFEQKKRCGFVDLGKQATAEGCVLKVNNHADGDFSIDLRLDESYEHLLYYQGHKNRDYLHVEFMPCEREYQDVTDVLQKIENHYNSELFSPEQCSMRVRVEGRWAYDGVDHRGDWKDQLGNCINGRGADPEVGWTEIHPAYSAEILR